MLSPRPPSHLRFHFPWSLPLILPRVRGSIAHHAQSFFQFIIDYSHLFSHSLPLHVNGVPFFRLFFWTYFFSTSFHFGHYFLIISQRFLFIFNRFIRNGTNEIH